MNALRDKKILVTAGSTWVALDSVRVITNIFTGALGLRIAEEARRRGAEVTLLMGPTSISLPLKEKPGLRIVRFKFYDNLYRLMEKEICSGQYDAVIHSAAVSDYVPAKVYEGKMKSGKKELVIRMVPTKKIVDEVKKWDPRIFLVKFKVETNVNQKELVEIAYNSMRLSNADMIVANDSRDIAGDTHKTLIIDRDRKVILSKNKKETAKNLLDLITKNI